MDDDYVAKTVKVGQSAGRGEYNRKIVHRGEEHLVSLKLECGHNVRLRAEDVKGDSVICITCATAARLGRPLTTSDFTETGEPTGERKGQLDERARIREVMQVYETYLLSRSRSKVSTREDKKLHQWGATVILPNIIRLLDNMDAQLPDGIAPSGDPQ
jgi:hypothetical protein